MEKVKVENIEFSMYYKDNKKEGFGLRIHNHGEKHIERIIRTLDDIYNHCETLYPSDTSSIKGVKKHLEKRISDWNTYQNLKGRVDNPIETSIHPFKFDFTHEKFIRMVIDIMYGIYFLLKRGYIKNDKWNGFQFINTIKV
tara:strand:+ start:88 stop:510 length:423 start_codon:yes stop_codon:yes gene_type:complete